MREIKFRAWDEADGYYLDEGRMSFIKNPDCDASAIMQYTDLKDKNGVDIYEGDIVLSPNNFMAIVKWYKYKWVLDVQFQKHVTRYDLSPNRAKDKCEVIGNIYENHQLLEVNR